MGLHDRKRGRNRVVLLAEDVDRNLPDRLKLVADLGRPPRGGRG